MPTIVQQPLIVVRLVDATESRAEMRFHVQASTNRAIGIAAGDQLVGLVGAASEATVYERVLRYPVMITGGAAAVDSSVKETGVLIFRTTMPEQYAIIEIFGIKSALRNPDNVSELLITASPLQDYINALVNGNFSNPFGYQLTECIAGLYQLRP